MASYNDYSYNLAREFSNFLQRERKVKTSISLNLIHVVCVTGNAFDRYNSD